jgi:hypothetical protein
MVSLLKKKIGYGQDTGKRQSDQLSSCPLLPAACFAKHACAQPPALMLLPADSAKELSHEFFGLKLATIF